MTARWTSGDPLPCDCGSYVDEREPCRCDDLEAALDRDAAEDCTFAEWSALVHP